MKIRELLKNIWILCLALTLVVAPRVFAQDNLDDFGGLDDASSSGTQAENSAVSSDKTAPDTSIKSSKSEKEIIDTLADLPKSAFEPIKPKKDPFLPLVQKRLITPPIRRRIRPRINRTFKPKAPPIKPIKLFVSGIVGNESNRLAIVKFEGKELTIWKDKVVDGKFKVVDILNDRVVIYSNKEQRRHTFRIAGGRK